MVNISHNVLPEWDRHVKFVASRPYSHWWIIQRYPGRMPVGACYISKNNEVGLFISIDEQGKGYGTAALREMLSLTKGIKLYANINPANDRSRRLFEGNGFRLIQQTFALENPMLGQSRNTDTHPDP